LSTPATGRTALVHDWLTGMRGGEKVLEAIIDLYPEAPIYTLLHLPGRLSRKIEQRTIHTSFLQHAPGIEKHYRRYLPLFPAAIEDFDLSGYDLVISTSHCVAKGAIPAPGAFHICYCHTPMRYAWDQEHAYFPQRRGPVARLRNAVLTRMRTWDVSSSVRVDLFVANSRFVASRIRRYYGREAEVLHPPVDTDFYTPGAVDESTGDYFLAVAALSPYKRLAEAIGACESLGVDLRIVGSGPQHSELQALAGPHTRLLGRVDDETLRQLYRGARAVLQPAIEDFGITAVEALACGTPLIAQAAGGVLDIVRDGTDGLLYNGGQEALAAAIDKSGEFLFNKLNARQRAEEFSQIRFQQRLESILASVPRSGENGP